MCTDSQPSSKTVQSLSSSSLLHIEVNFHKKLIQWSHLSQSKSQKHFEINLNDFKLQNGNLFPSQHVSFVFSFGWKERQTFLIEFNKLNFIKSISLHSLLGLLLEFFKADAQSNFYNFGFTPRITLAWFTVFSFSFLVRFSISCGLVWRANFPSRVLKPHLPPKKMIRPLMITIINSNYSR